MDAKQMGVFIAELRKEKKLTQEELAGELNVTGKAVSRWETGTGFPDVSSMLALSSFFGVSINELLYGKRSEPEKADDAAAIEEQKKQEAQIACDNLDLSIKKRRLTKLIAAMSVLLCAACVFILCVFVKPKQARPAVDAVEPERYFSPVSQGNVPAPFTPAKLIDLKTGALVVACGDPECTHAATDESCFFNRSKDKTEVYAVQYVDNHIFFAAMKKLASGSDMKLWDYDMETGGCSAIYDFSFVDRNIKLFSCRGKLFFTVPERVEDGSNLTSLYMYELGSGTITLLNGNVYDLLESPDRIAFYDDHYIFLDRHASGENLRYCRCSYDGEKEYFDTLPDGTPLDPFGFELVNGLFAKTFSPGGIFDAASGRCLDLPTDCAITAPVSYGDSFYYQTRRSDSAANLPVFDNEVYVIDSGSGCRHYSIDCPYHFTLCAAYGDIILGRIRYKLQDGRRFDYEDSSSFIRIDLSSGEACIYDGSMRSGATLRNFTLNITIKDN